MMSYTFHIVTLKLHVQMQDMMWYGMYSTAPNYIVSYAKLIFKYDLFKVYLNRNCSADNSCKFALKLIQVKMFTFNLH